VEESSSKDLAFGVVVPIPIWVLPKKGAHNIHRRIRCFFISSD